LNSRLERAQSPFGIKRSHFKAEETLSEEKKKRRRKREKESFLSSRSGRQERRSIDDEFTGA